MTQDAFFVTLKNRALLSVTGADSFEFLQNLITNDMKRLKTEPSLYACLLTPQGKFAYDFIISRTDGGYVLDCEGGERAQVLFQKLSMYKLRADVELALEGDKAVYAIFVIPSEVEGSSKIPPRAALGRNDSWIEDPRHPEMGYRSFEKPNLPERTFEEWDHRRIALTIPDGSRDMIEGKTTMDEANMEVLNGVSFEKGCYVGQELTARVKYRGLGKKKLATVRISETQNLGIPEHHNSKILKFGDSQILDLRSTCSDIGIALVRV